MKNLAAILAGMTRAHVFRGLADLAEGIDAEQNPYPPFNLNELGPRTYIGGEPYNARTLVAFAAKHGPRGIPVGDLVSDDRDGDGDRLCRERLRSLGFQFHELRKD